ncbi:unnamed protein product [Cuscuta europaea]|uniref:Uncharacterized protein n=1 Tax=Cuscuta europaea TaxID=41803 RepID=A0A9P0ZWI3_CUSEU|nr:unnamed protein product [Cuscuta europaea]
MEEVTCNKRVRDDSDEFSDGSPDVKKLRGDLLDDLDEENLWTEGQDLESFMKSFEDEIAPSPSKAVEIIDLTSDSGDSLPDLGYLFGASDDELGLPPAGTSQAGEQQPEKSELIWVSSDPVELKYDSWGMDGQIPSYDSFEFGLPDPVNFSTVNDGEYEALDGLFDHSDLTFGWGDNLWRSETLPLV